jgi:hypothetical protein
MSLRDAVRGARAKVFPVDTPSGRFFVRQFDGATRQKYIDIVQAGNGAFPIGAVVALGLCEEDGSGGYDVDSASDVAEVSGMDTATLDAICTKLIDVSGLTVKAGDVAEKKSEASPSG